MGAYDRDSTVHTLFSRQADVTPHAIAIVARDGAEDGLDVEEGDFWRYGVLDSHADCLAKLIAASGVGPGDRVALLCGRSAETIIAMLAVLKCGAAFVPLDPSYPPARVALMLTEAEPALLLMERGLDLPDMTTQLPTLDLAAALAAALQMPDLPAPDVRVTAEDAAYVMFTSGSTGKPKGVVVPHRAIVRLVRDQSYARFAADEVFLHLAPLAFDASTFEIWGALLNGARLAIVPQARPSLDDILDTVMRQKVTVAWFTAGLFHALVDHRVSGLAPLRRLLAGGDVLSPSHVARVRSALPHCQIVNGYGPTENTTFSCCHVITDADDASVPIGACISHSTAWVADEQLAPVADGAPGQLVVGGDGLAIGYLNAPELTASKFVAAPVTGERLYLTGDVAVRRADGVFIFQGRADRQVKIDGKRVELGEIEAALRDCPGVADAAVLFCDTGKAGAPKRLLAWVVAGQQGAADYTPAALQAALRKAIDIALPAHMQPARISVLQAMPLTDNGKLDRQHLQDLATDALVPDTPARQTSPVELLPAGERDGASMTLLRDAATSVQVRAIVAAAWADVLGIAAPPPDVSFFDLGGTSLLLMRVQARVNSAGAPALPVLEYFAHPTINALVARMTDVRNGSPDRVNMPPRGEGVLDARRVALGRMRARAGGAQ